MTNQILWEERNLIEHPMNCEIKEEQETSDITKSTKTSLMPSDWRSIIDPKLRKEFWARARAKAYRTANKGERKAYDEAYYKTNEGKRKAYYEANKIEIKSRSKAYAKANRDKLNANRRSRMETDIQFKISATLRSRLFRALRNNQKTGSAVRDLGCSIPELKTYLESKFQPGMTWGNWSHAGWHIDHIKPLASFDLGDRNQLLEACNYTNLQPLWAIDNFSKGDKI